MNISPQITIVDDDFVLLWQFTAWLEQVITNVGIDYYRRQERNKRERNMELFLESAQSYEQPLPINEKEFEFEEEKLSQAFSKLNSMRRHILTLIFVEGLSAQETADKLCCSVDYVYLQKHRALKKLRNQLLEGGGNHGK